MNGSEAVPPGEFLERIEWRGDEPACRVFPAVAGSAACVARRYGSMVPNLMALIKRRYQERCQQRACVPQEKVCEITDLLIWELLLNASEHGNARDPNRKAYVMAWQGDEGIVIGCRDEGDFFKKEETKKKFEGRQRIYEKDRKDRGHGTKFMYIHADDICVDTATGTIFILLFYEGGT